MAAISVFYLNLILIFSTSIILWFASLKIFHLVYNEQNSAYIDEIFHIPQAQLYCNNQWMEWNPKITTLPGLYLVSYSILKVVEILKHESFCSLYYLRVTNLIGTILNFFLVYMICSSLEKKHKVKSQGLFKILTALNVAIFPPLYFFSFLYYTDVWSMTFILLMYKSHLSNWRLLALFSSIMAVLMRQTNIIWVGFMIIDETWTIICQNERKVSVQEYKYTINVLKALMSKYFKFNKNKLKKFVSFIGNVLCRTYHYITVCLLFILFVFLNGSIVLGDKEAHKATFHLMQNLYFLDFIAFFGLPFFILEAPSLLTKPPNIFLLLFQIGLCAGLSESNKLEHPYLLADNRHIAFYVWKRLFGHSIIRRMLVPTYICSGVLLFRILQKRCHFMTMVALSVCMILNLTPQFLFELRYFIIPFVMYRLHFKPNQIVLLETIFFIIINCGIFYLFLNRTFAWPSEPHVKQRFIW